MQSLSYILVNALVRMTDGRNYYALVSEGGVAPSGSSTRGLLISDFMYSFISSSTALCWALFSSVSLSFYADGKTPWISSSQGLYLHTGQHKHRINTYKYETSMPFMGFEPTIPASERAKTVHALDRSALDVLLHLK
jgi:hypothetical protein